MNEFFRKAAHAISEATGTPWAFMVALAIIITWAISGPLFDFSNTWQLLINSGTTIATFLMVFLIQNTQNRDAKAVHLKLDELIRGVEGARTRLVDLENLTDEELDDLQAQFKRLRERGGGYPTSDARTEGMRPAVNRELNLASARAEDERLDAELEAAREDRKP